MNVYCIPYWYSKQPIHKSAIQPATMNITYNIDCRIVFFSRYYIIQQLVVCMIVEKFLPIFIFILFSILLFFFFVVWYFLLYSFKCYIEKKIGIGLLSFIASFSGFLVDKPYFVGLNCWKKYEILSDMTL